jgi:hypothetical protein
VVVKITGVDHRTTKKKTLDVKRISIKAAPGSHPYYDSTCVGQPDTNGKAVELEDCDDVFNIPNYPDPLSCKVKPNVHQGQINEAMYWLNIDDMDFKNILAFKND